MTVLQGQRLLDIHRSNPPMEFMGNAGPYQAEHLKTTRTAGGKLEFVLDPQRRLTRAKNGSTGQGLNT